MKQLTLLLPLAALGLGTAPTLPPPAQATLTVRNQLNQLRRAETISLPLAQLPASVRQLAPASLRVHDAATKQVLVSQLLDNDGDGRPDALLFQTDVPAKGTKTFTLAAGTEAVPSSAVTTFARFVPERTDDFAWENERVAFRTYGPNAEQLFDKKDPAGTLSSGMDCWLKRVSYPIIDKWYGQHVRTPFSYHKDTGEGYDPYHVGTSRGVGGTGVLEGGKLYISKNFATYKVLATGPIRTVFELTYAPWDAAGKPVTEKKIISLDLGSNLTRYEETMTAPTPLPNCTIGLTLHEAKGAVRADRAAGWFRYWEAVDDSFLGTGVVVAPSAITDYEDHRSPDKDANQLYIVTKPQQHTVVFYAGFGWTKSGQFASAAAWDAYLAEFAQRLASPLKVSW
ncbi:DUF4861 domain-containing protein [Hymenobacter sp. UV11]|uniref:DUF4861 domain-containing protein n=1 Tax=Hymenobacter sp. UV11 TaxID=1849735 RepID=UPI00105E1C7E|nr:DUF4861 domain-containing protein [Hymenobacter sp. UV11]TDN37556.1 hypothetical protein A8B98_03240 [Hymenobacter sp. UV11]TFZ68752.1 DUF4861 domain-containing protein [Hymenobacter sp. UV11]